MPKITNTIWRSIGQQLHNEYKPKYLTHQRFNRFHFLQPVTPYHQTFFGTKTHNIIIVNTPYDWEDEDLLAALNESQNLIKQNYHKLPQYHVWIYLDFIFAQMVEDSVNPGGGSTDIRSKLEENEPHIIEICDNMAEYGFWYGGRLEDPDIGAAFFYEQINDFYALREVNQPE